ncbi:prefoldin subunit alpha [Candidatus Micrarchaeota archaeon]|nr:prefoldin subunit alpha [Candidatus Micrarchaeota archaeon]
MAQNISNPNPANLQRQLEQKSFEINYMRNQAQQLENQMQLVQKVLADIENTRQSLAVTDQLQTGTMLPLGSGVFAKAKAENTGVVLLDVGASVLVEKKPEETAKILEQRKAALEKNMAELSAAFERVANQINQLTAQAEKMARQVQTG